MLAQKMNMGLLTMPPGSRLPANSLPALIVHKGMRVQTAFSAAFPGK